MAITTNKRAHYDYEILDKFVAGIVLTGAEVKSVKAGRADLKGSFVSIDNNQEAWLQNTYIAPYPPAKREQKNYEPNRNRKLLLRSRETSPLIGSNKIKGQTLVPLKFFTQRGLVKLELGLGQGKKQRDKREQIKKRDFERKKSQLMKRVLGTV